MIIDAKIIFDFYWIYFLSDNFVYKTHHSTPNLGQGTHSNVFKSVQMLQLTYFAVAVVCSFLVVHLWLCNMQQFMKNIWPSFKRASFPFFFFWSVHLRTKRNQMTTTQQTNKMHCWDLNNFVHNNKFQFLILTVFFSFAFFASFVNRIKIAFAFTYLIFSFWTKFLFSAEAHIPYCTY